MEPIMGGRSESSRKWIFFRTGKKKNYGAELITTEKDYMRIDSDNRQNFNCIPIKVNLENPNFLKNFLRKKIL